MIKKELFYGSALKGRFIFKEPDWFRNFMLLFPDGTDMVMEVKKLGKIRTSKQPGEDTNFNGYYWGIIVKAAAGPDAMADIDMDYVDKCLQIQVGNFRVDNDGNKIPRGTSWMTGAEFAEYCMKCRMFLNQFYGLYVPEPREGDEYLQ